jgi:hypothetical protein
VLLLPQKFACPPCLSLLIVGNSSIRHSSSFVFCHNTSAAADAKRHSACYVMMVTASTIKLVLSFVEIGQTMETAVHTASAFTIGNCMAGYDVCATAGRTYRRRERRVDGYGSCVRLQQDLSILRKCYPKDLDVDGNTTLNCVLRKYGGRK